MHVIFQVPTGESATVDEERAAFLVEALRLRASGEHGKIADPNRITALAAAIEARAAGTATGPIRLEQPIERDTLLAIVNVAAIGDSDRALRDLHRVIREWWDARDNAG